MSKIFGISNLPVAKMFPSVEPTKFVEVLEKDLSKFDKGRDTFERMASKNFNEIEKQAKKLFKSKKI